MRVTKSRFVRVIVALVGVELDAPGIKCFNPAVKRGNNPEMWIKSLGLMAVEVPRRIRRIDLDAPDAYTFLFMESESLRNKCSK